MYAVIMNNLWLKIKKKINNLGILGFLIVVSVIGAIHIYNKPDKFEVDFLDIGQGDSILINMPGGEKLF